MSLEVAGAVPVHQGEAAFDRERGIEHFDSAFMAQWIVMPSNRSDDGGGGDPADRAGLQDGQDAVDERAGFN